MRFFLIKKRLAKPKLSYDQSQVLIGFHAFAGNHHTASLPKDSYQSERICFQLFQNV